MAKFLDGISKESPVSINRANVFWMCDFDLPESVKESKSLIEISELHGEFLMGFYCDPQMGDLITHKGYLWKVTGRHFKTYRYKERAQRTIPKLLLEFLGEVEQCNS